MKVRNSLKSLRSRHRNNQLVRRRGRVYVINKTQRRFKARQEAECGPAATLGRILGFLSKFRLCCAAVMGLHLPS